MKAMKSHIWLRAETKEFERRSPLTAAGAKALIADGHTISVEKSADRIFPDQAYQDVGCALVEAGSWREAPDEAIILGLKELPEDTYSLTHQHIFFAHAYKGQSGARELLTRFKQGSGQIFDLEYLTDENHRRVAAFGFWAGFAGAAAAIDAWNSLSEDKPVAPLHDYDHQDLWIKSIKSNMAKHHPRVIVVGAKGRCGSGALSLLSKVGITATEWDFEETKHGGPFEEIAQHDIFINTALIMKRIPPFITEETLTNKPLSLVCDVSCDPNSEMNPIPIYKEVGSWPRPVQNLSLAGKTRHILAVDNLPSLLPLESSEDFATQLLPHLREFAKNRQAPVWQRSLDQFKSYSERI